MTRGREKKKQHKSNNITREEPTFYCETCGHQVGVYEDECPHCGMPFYGVKCPRCGFNGKARQFVNGCPRCGFKAAPAGSLEMVNVEGLNGRSATEPEEKAKRESQSMWLLLLVVFLLGTAVAAAIVMMLL